MISRKNRELQMLSDAAMEFSKKVLGPAVADSDQYPFGPFPGHLLEKAFDLDFFHILLPEKAGGMEMGITALCKVVESICQTDASFGATIFTAAFTYDLILQASGIEALEQYTPFDGKVQEFLIAAPIYGNPSEAKPAVSARFEHGRYLLTGLTELLVLGNIAERGLIPAVIQGQDGYSYFQVDLNQDTLSISEPVLSLGMHACPFVDVTFDNAVGRLVGEAKKGAVYFQKTSERFLPVVAAMALGVMKGAYKEAVTYAGNRKQGGKTIIDWSELRTILSDMALKIKISEMAVAYTSTAVDEEIKGWQPLSLATALESTDMACMVTTDGIQVLGGVGYMKDFGQEKRFRDARHIQNLFGPPPMKKARFFESVV